MKNDMGPVAGKEFAEMLKVNKTLQSIKYVHANALSKVYFVDYPTWETNISSPFLFCSLGANDFDPGFDDATKAAIKTAWGADRDMGKLEV